MRRQPQVSGPARHCPAAARAGRGGGTWGRAAGGLASRAAGRGPRSLGLGAHPTPWVASLSSLRVSAERRPQEAAPREAAADRRAQRQTSKRAGPARTPASGPRGVAGYLAAPEKVRASAQRAQTPSGVRVRPQSYRAPLFWKERAEGESAVAERQELHLKGGARPGVHFELVDMFWGCGHFSRLGGPPSRRLEGRGGGTVICAWTPNYLGAISGFHCTFYVHTRPSGRPRPSLLQRHFLFLEPDASSRGTKETCPRDPPILPQLWSAGVRCRWGPRRSPPAPGWGARPPTPSRLFGKEKLSIVT